jgi:transposase
MDEPACPGCRALLKRVAELEALVADLSRRLDEALRAGKRQAAPFRKGPPKPDPQPPGRKSGDAHGEHAHRPPPPPGAVSECHDAPLPDACPHCRGSLVETGVADQYQTDISRRPIVRHFRVHVGHCRACGRRAQGRHALQTSDALGAAGSQIGPDAQAAVVLLNKDLGLSHGKVAGCLDKLFGIGLTRGASAQIVLRAAERCRPVYEAIRRAARDSPVVVPDETGWHVGGRSAWLHAFAGRDVTCYAIDPTRGGRPAAELLGEDYSGILIHDGWSVYDTFAAARHQQCLAHLLRRCRELLETAARGAVRFPRAVAALLRAALRLRDRHAAGAVGDHGLAVARGRLYRRLLDLVWPAKTHAGNERLAAFLWGHRDDLFTFLAEPGLDATNWRAEQAIRPAVVNRKVWGGNRTWAGAGAQAVLMSVLATSRQVGRDALDFLGLAFRSRTAPVLITAA